MNELTYLYRRQVLFVKVGLGLMNIVAKAPANLRIDQTTLDGPPVLPVHHIMLQPMREVSDLILLVPSPRHRLPNPLVRHEYRENCEPDEPHDHQEYHGQVYVEERVEAAARTQ